MAGIFISYRREDSADICGRIYDHLVARYGKPAVFKDVDNIPYGANFPSYIQGKLRECSVCLAVIGPRWLSSATADGQRRLDDPADFVRVEIETALQLGLVVIPVLVYGTHVPPTEALPASMAVLPQLNAAPVRLDPDFGGDIRRLAEGTDHFVPPLAPAPTPMAPSKPLPWRTITEVLVLGTVSALVGALAPITASAGAGGSPFYLGVLVLNLIWLLFAGYLTGRHSDSPYPPMATGALAGFLVSVGYLFSAPPSSTNLPVDLIALLLVFALVTSLTVIGGAIGRAGARRRARRAAARVRTATSSAPTAQSVSHLGNSLAQSMIPPHHAQQTQPTLAPPEHTATSAPYVAAAPATPYVASAPPPLAATPYPGATAPVAPAAGRPKRRTAAIVAGIIGSVLLLTLIVGGLVRYNAPIGTVQAYLQAYYANDVNGAYSRYCPESQAAYSESQQQAVMAGVAAHGANFDLSQIRYTVQSENLTTANVRLGGEITYTNLSDNSQGTITLLDNATDIFNLRALGLGWCIFGVNGQTPKSSTSS